MDKWSGKKNGQKVNGDTKTEDGLSCIAGNCYVQFLGEKEAVRPPTYPAANVQESCCSKMGKSWITAPPISSNPRLVHPHQQWP